ncbi:hypothetical protein [Sinorhizobium psoraleae]|uniref:Uncharacterized protein n=1 Tax=Sinorhizobium psoraleae TaxID=520838 RepID=A0ABT4KML4_9HYPH|nr:hypothetical protein [Sinorhizobium psoraleae]MCZ4093045.1 hypothetical protein [Sinorhizobium psoraleae]
MERPCDCEAVKNSCIGGGCEKITSPLRASSAVLLPWSSSRPSAWWLKAKQDDWSTAFYLFVCAVLFSLIYLAARWMDKREAARSRKVADQLRRHGFDLSPTDYRSQSLRETRNSLRRRPRQEVGNLRINLILTGIDCFRRLSGNRLANTLGCIQWLALRERPYSARSRDLLDAA